MKNKTDFLGKIRHILYALLVTIFDKAFVGYLIIFSAIGIFGRTELWSCHMWLQIFMVAIGGNFLIYSKK